MGRPKSDDPKRAFTLRLPSSVLAIYEAAGKDWRAKLEAKLVAEVTPNPAVVEARAAPQEKLRRAAVPYGSRLKKR